MLISSAYAQGAGGLTDMFGSATQFLPLVLIFVVFYFLLIRPQNKRAKEQRDMISKIAPGDEVATSGGILGKVVDVSRAVPA